MFLFWKSVDGIMFLPHYCSILDEIFFNNIYDGSMGFTLVIINYQ